MSRRRARCFVSAEDLQRQVGDAVQDGRLTDEDAYQVLKFGEWLANVGPRIGPLTEEQAAFRRQALADPEWREFLGLPPLKPAEGQPS